MIYYEYTISNLTSCLTIIDNEKARWLHIEIEWVPSLAGNLRFAGFYGVDALWTPFSLSEFMEILRLFMHSELELWLIVYEKSSTATEEKQNFPI